MTEWVTIGDARLACGDCREILPELGEVDALVVDPPYGIKESAGKASGRTSGLTNPNKYQRDYGFSNWDDEPLHDVIESARQISRWQIIFGGNYYDLPPTSCWLIWDKMNGATDFADCEMAWTNLPKAVRQIQFHWNGCMRKERHIPKEHPTQKPVGVMEWAIKHLPESANTILDCTMGSGTTGVACAKLGRKFIGIEMEPRYFDISCKRIEEAYRQADLFVEPPKPEPLVQEGLF